MRYLILLLALTATACTTVPVKQEFPDLPVELTFPCSQLETIDTPEVTLTELMKKVGSNYAKRHECAALVDSFHKWYSEQKKIFDEANN